MPDPNPQVLYGIPDLYRRIGTTMIADAQQNQRSLSAWMDEIAVKPDAADKDKGLDAFGRVMEHKGWVVRSMPELGVFAEPCGTLLGGGPDRDQRRSLFLELAWRNFRAVGNARKLAAESAEQRAAATFLSQDFVLNSALNPYTTDLTPRSQVLEPAIPISEIVARQTNIPSSSYRTVYIVETPAAKRRMVRVGERAEIPRVALTLSERSVDLFKYGRAVEATYEALREQPLDRMAAMVQEVALQAELDRFATIIDVLLNGDGTGAAITSYRLKLDLDPAATVPVISARAYLAFKQKFKNPFQLTHLLMQDAVSLDVQLLTVGNANTPLATFPAAIGPVTVINRSLRDAVRLGESDDVPATKVLGLDASMAIDHLVQIGSDIQESDRFITNQTELMTMTINEGWQIIKEKAIRAIDLSQ